MPEPDVRFSLANERTLLAYHRTAIGLVAAAVAIVHFVSDGWAAKALAGVLLVAGVSSAVGGVLRFRKADRAIRDGRGIDVGVVPYVVTAAVVAGVLLAAIWIVGGAR